MKGVTSKSCNQANQAAGLITTNRKRLRGIVFKCVSTDQRRFVVKVLK